MKRIVTIPIGKLRVDPKNPRKSCCPAALQALAENMLLHGQLIHVIVKELGEGLYLIIDGHRRFYASELAGIPELNAVVMLEDHTEAELRMTQLSVEIHKISLTLMERSNLLMQIREETTVTVAELAKAAAIEQGTASKLLGLQRLAPDLQNLVHEGKLDLERAYFISREPDFEKQRELAHAASSLSRDQLRQRVKPSTPKPSDQVKTAKAVFALPTGNSVTVKGKGLSNPVVIELLLELVRDLKRAVTEHLDIKTTEKVFADRARATPAM